MSYKSVIAGSLGIVAALGVFAVVGFAPSNATTGTTTVSVIIGEECMFGDGSGTSDNQGAAALEVSLSQTTPFGTQGSGSSNYLGITCNSATWSLSEQINASSTVNLVGETNSAIGFTPWSAGTASNASDFAANTWGMKYAENAAIAGNSVTSAAQAWHAVPANGSPSVIASGVAVSGYKISQTFGAKTDGSVAADTYSTQILYTLTGV